MAGTPTKVFDGIPDIPYTKLAGSVWHQLRYPGGPLWT